MSRQQEQELNQLRLHYSKQRSMEYLLDKLEARIVRGMQEMEERVHQRLSSIEAMMDILTDHYICSRFPNVSRMYPSMTRHFSTLLLKFLRWFNLVHTLDLFLRLRRLRLPFPLGILSHPSSILPCLLRLTPKTLVSYSEIAFEWSPIVLSLRRLHTIHPPTSQSVKLTKTILESKLINGFGIIGWWCIVVEWPIYTRFSTALGVWPIVKNMNGSYHPR